MIFLEPFTRKKAPPKPRTILFAAKGDAVPRPLTVEQFEGETGVHYLEHLAFSTKKTYERVKKLTARAVEKEKVSKRAEWLGIHYRNWIFSGAVNDISIRWIDQRVGYGVFAERDLEEGEYIGEYVGLVKRCPYLFSGVNEYCFRYPLYRIGFFIYTIDAKEYCNEISFINHSKNPNCESVVTLNNDLLHICIRSLKPIPKDSQLAFDYGNDFE